MDAKDRFRQRFNSLFEVKQKTVADLARELGVKPPTIIKYRNGVAAPSLEVLVRMSIAFNCTTDYLLGLVDEEGHAILATNDLSAIEQEILVFFKDRPLEEQRRFLDLVRLASR